MVLTFPGPGYLCFEDGVFWLAFTGKFVYIAHPFILLRLNPFDLSVAVEASKNVSWPWLSLLRGWGSLTMAFPGKYVHIYIYIYIYIAFVKDHTFLLFSHKQLFWWLRHLKVDKWECQNRKISISYKNKKISGTECWQLTDVVMRAILRKINDLMISELELRSDFKGMLQWNIENFLKKPI